MTYSCPICASTAVELAGRTDMYQSLICHDCQAWSTVPVQPPPKDPPRPPKGKA